MPELDNKMFPLVPGGIEGYSGDVHKITDKNNQITGFACGLTPIRANRNARLYYFAPQLQTALKDLMSCYMMDTMGNPISEEGFEVRNRVRHLLSILGEI